MMKHCRVFVLFCLLLSLNGSVRAQDKLRAAFGSLAASHMVLLVAKDLRFFQKYNVEAEVVGHIPGAKAVFPLISGDAQVIHAAGPPFRAKRAGRQRRRDVHGTYQFHVFLRRST